MRHQRPQTEPDPDFTPVHRALLFFFLLLFVGTLWPIYTFFSRIYPMILGLPFSLFYQVVLVALAFSALLGVYLWEGRRAGRRPSATASPPSA
jgi:hypothetical protein